MAKLKILLVHTDATVRSSLRKKLEDIPFVRVLGEATSSKEALELANFVPYGVFFIGTDLNDELSNTEFNNARMNDSELSNTELHNASGSKPNASAHDNSAHDSFSGHNSSEHNNSHIDNSHDESHIANSHDESHIDESELNNTQIKSKSTVLSLASSLQAMPQNPAVILVASDSSLAYEAFEHGVLDYLVWEPNEERFAKTIKRLQEFKAHYLEVPEPNIWQSHSPDENIQEQTVHLKMLEEEEKSFLTALENAWSFKEERKIEQEKLPIVQDGRKILVPYTQIIFIEAFEDYSYIHTAQQKILSSYRLKALEERLSPYGFFRAHRKYLVNLTMVNEIAPLAGNNFVLRTAGKTRIELPIGRRRVPALKQVLGF